MKKKSETGHVKNVAKFEALISFVSAYGATYNPVNTALQITKLKALLGSARNSLSSVKTTVIAYNNATNDRMNLFKPLKSLGTKLINALDAANADKETVKDARTILRKLQGQRAKQKPVAVVPPGETPAVKTISSSQQSFDQQIESFAKLIELLSSVSNYAPNETDLKVTTLTDTLKSLQTTNTMVINKYTTLSNSRNSRNEILYNPITGLVTIAMGAKKYVKSIYGSTSVQFKQLSTLGFRKLVF